MSGWVAKPLGGGVVLEGLEEFFLDDDRRGCGDRYEGDPHTWWCTRVPHKGRHMATGGGVRVFAAWPGDHEPTPEDLREVS